MTNKSISKVAKNYLCNFCHYNTSKKTNYDKHILTLKHINTKNTNKSSEKEPNEYNCECGKTYKHQSSLWNHKQKCKTNVWLAKENPYHGDAESIESEKYLKIVGESMGGLTEEDDIENYNRIITTIAKEVIIEKE